MRTETKLLLAASVVGAGIIAYHLVGPKTAKAGPLPPAGITDEILKDQAELALSYVPTIRSPGVGTWQLDVGPLQQAVKFFAANGGAAGLAKYVAELQQLQDRIIVESPAGMREPPLDAHGPWALYYWALYRNVYDPKTGAAIGAQGYPQTGAIVDWNTQEGIPTRSKAATRDHALELVRKSV